jgi:hypothetical protein
MILSAHLEAAGIHIQVFKILCQSFIYPFWRTGEMGPKEIVTDFVEKCFDETIVLLKHNFSF